MALKQWADSGDDPVHLGWLSDWARHDGDEEVRRDAVDLVTQAAPRAPETRALLRDLATADPHRAVRASALGQLGEHCDGDAETVRFLRDRAASD